MKCTISHMVTAGRSYICTLRNACATAGKIYHGCFEMLSWPHRTSAYIINICFWLLETCTKCSYFIEENIRPGAQRLAFEVKYKSIYTGHEHTVGRQPVLGQVSRQPVLDVSKVSASITTWCTCQNTICSGRSVMIHLQNIKKTVKTGLVSISLLQANKWALSSGKTLIPGQKICRACWCLLQDLLMMPPPVHYHLRRVRQNLVPIQPWMLP